MSTVQLQLLMLLCDQCRYMEANALLDRYIARMEWDARREQEQKP